jgi:hypothetical protein
MDSQSADFKSNWLNPFLQLLSLSLKQPITEPIPNYMTQSIINLTTVFQNTINPISDISLTAEQQSTIYKVIELLWRFDLQRDTSKLVYYPQMITNIARCISANVPITLLQFTCPARRPEGVVGLDSENCEEYLITDPMQNNLRVDMPYLIVLKTELDRLGVKNDLKIIMADTSVYWMNFNQGRVFGVAKEIVATKLIPRYVEAQKRLQEFVNEQFTSNSAAEIISNYELEKDIESQTGSSYIERWQEIRKQIIASTDTDWPRIVYNSYRTQLIQNGENKNTALALAKIWLDENKDRVSLIDSFLGATGILTNDILELGIVWEIEYRINGIDFELLFPNAILIQNEAQAQTKNQLYSSMRKTQLPIISRVL